MRFTQALHLPILDTPALILAMRLSSMRTTQSLFVRLSRTSLGFAFRSSPMREAQPPCHNSFITPTLVSAFRTMRTAQPIHPCPHLAALVFTFGSTSVSKAQPSLALRLQRTATGTSPRACFPTSVLSTQTLTRCFLVAIADVSTHRLTSVVPAHLLRLAFRTLVTSAILALHILPNNSKLRGGPAIVFFLILIYVIFFSFIQIDFILVCFSLDVSSRFACRLLALRVGRRHWRRCCRRVGRRGRFYETQER